MKVGLAALGEVSEFIRGITFTPNDVEEVASTNTVGVMRTKNVQEQLDLNDVWKINRKFVKNKNQYLEEGDLLVSTANSWNLVGKASWVPLLNYESSFGGFVTVLRGNKKLVDRRYLYYWFVSDRIQELLRSFSNKTTNISNLSLSRAKELTIPLPPLAEQQRIAALLDTADRILKQRELAIAKLDQLAQSVFVEMFGDVVSNNKNWPIHEFSKLADNEDYKRKPIKSSDRDNRGGAYPYYGASGIIDTIDEYIFEGDSLLIGEDGANLVARSSPIAFIARGKYWVNNHAHILRQNRNANIRYLEYFLLQIDLKPYVTGSAQPKLTRGNLDRILVPTPPIKLQNHFEKIIIELEAEKDVMNSNQRVALKLVSSLQHQSFAVN